MGALVKMAPVVRDTVIARKFVLVDDAGVKRAEFRHGNRRCCATSVGSSLLDELRAREILGAMTIRESAK
jgi:hypothetical protein